jgi:hypothetical protein
VLRVRPARDEALHGRRIEVASVRRAVILHVEVPVADRPPAPAPLFRVDEWARAWAVEEVFGVERALLNVMRSARQPGSALRRALPCPHRT